ncbi:MAG: hypothetical protein KBD83_03050 [Gammaproteobacteria bacterium]|nr:hypothetical protein [Gammaproteobacteria bacterium]
MHEKLSHYFDDLEKTYEKNMSENQPKGRQEIDHLTKIVEDFYVLTLSDNELILDCVKSYEIILGKEDNSLDDLKKCFKKIEDFENVGTEDAISSIRWLFKGGERFFTQSGYSLQEAPLSYGYKIIFISLYFEISRWFQEKNRKKITSVESSNIELNGEDDGITFASDAVNFFFKKIAKIIKSQAEIQYEKFSALGIFKIPVSEFIQYPNELLHVLAYELDTDRASAWP